MRLKVSRFFKPKQRRPSWIGTFAASFRNGTYGTGTVIPLKIVFSAPVNVTGQPHLALNSGGVAVYTSGSGSATLVFTYTVTACENSNDLNYASTDSLTLNGGTIKDSGTGVDAVLTLPALADPNSLGSQKDIVISTGAPPVLLPDLLVSAADWVQV